jgi:hypothetical protein
MRFGGRLCKHFGVQFSGHRYNLIQLVSTLCKLLGVVWVVGRPTIKRSCNEESSLRSTGGQGINKLLCVLIRTIIVCEGELTGC